MVNSISKKLLLCESLSEEILTCSQLNLSLTIQSFCKEATSFSSIFTLCAGQMVGAFAKSECFRLLPAIFGNQSSKIPFYHYASIGVACLAEGIAFNSASTLAKTGDFKLGLWQENLHGTLSIITCKAIGAGLPFGNVVIQHFLQDFALVTIDFSFEKIGLLESKTECLIERVMEAEIASIRMECSAKITQTIGVEISYFHAQQVLSYKIPKQHHNPQNHNPQNRDHKTQSIRRLADHLFPSKSLVTNEGFLYGENHLPEDSLNVKMPGMFMTYGNQTGERNRGKETVIEKLNRAFKAMSGTDIEDFSRFRKETLDDLSSHSDIYHKAVADFQTVEKNADNEEFHLALSRLEKVAVQKGIVHRYGAIRNGSQSLFIQSVGYTYFGKEIFKNNRGADYFYVAREKEPVQYTPQAELFFERAKENPQDQDLLFHFQFLDFINRIGGVVTQIANLEILYDSYETRFKSLAQRTVSKASAKLRKDGGATEVIEVLVPYENIFMTGQEGDSNLVDAILKPIESALDHRIQLVVQSEQMLKIRIPSLRFFQAFSETVHGKNSVRMIPTFEEEVSRDQINQMNKEGKSPVGFFKTNLKLGDLKALTHPWFFTVHDIFHAIQKSAFQISMREYFTWQYELLRNDEHLRRDLTGSSVTEPYFNSLADGYNGYQPYSYPRPHHYYDLLLSYRLNPFYKQKYQNATFIKKEGRAWLDLTDSLFFVEYCYRKLRDNPPTNPKFLKWHGRYLAEFRKRRSEWFLKYKLAGLKTPDRGRKKEEFLDRLGDIILERSSRIEWDCSAWELPRGFNFPEDL